MKRRQALEKTAYLMPGIWSIPGVMGFIQSCGQKEPPAGNLLALEDTEFQLVSLLADIILPATDSPSASEVQVPQFIDLLLHEVLEPAVKNQFIKGLNMFNQTCQQVTGKTFEDLDFDARTQYVEQVDSSVAAEPTSESSSFYSMFKQLVIKIYFSSEQGVKQNLNYQPVPGPFQSDVALQSGDKVMLGNDM